MAINWSIVEAIGTWFSGIITAGTLLFMYVQYRSDKKERLKKEELDKAYEREREMLRLNDESYRDLCNIPPEGMEAILNSPQVLKQYKERFIGIARFNEVMAHNIGIFKSKDPIRGDTLECIFLNSLSYELVACYNSMGASHKLNNHLREMQSK